MFGCVPSINGSGSGLSQYYEIEFDAQFNNQTTRLRTGYIAMCASINFGEEHCAITLGANRDKALGFLSGGPNADSYYNLSPTNQLNGNLFDMAANLQKNVLLALPVAPGIFLFIGFSTLVIYGLFNRPFRAGASEFKHFTRNRTLDVMRFVILFCTGLAFLFAFAIAVSASQMYAAIMDTTNHDGITGPFTTTESSGTLALHWLVAICCLLFFIGLIVTITAITKVSVTVTPEATSGTSGAKSFSSDQPMERASLLGHAAPVGMMPPPIGLTPQPPSGGMGMMGGRGGMRGRGGPRGAMRGRAGATARRPVGMRGR